MYLKRLDLQGFKSFPEKVKLEFNKGITTVVGPNGSGKSNISDSVRWVLGEQKAKSLRGDKMEDIIFAGTQNRKPLGFAEVSITIDNQDHKLPIEYTEVTVTRRVFRSGDSDYLINGTNCRLKDIHELFMDTGIGREGYSIIGQGKIDEILSSKSDDRRRLFEEAAGIVKYKNRRQEAMMKLDKEQQNLVRVKDIILELETQIVPLEKQSETARIYLGLKEKLKETEINLFLIQADQLEEQLKKLDDSLKIAQEQIDAETKDYQKSKEKSGFFREEANRLSQELQTVNDSIIEIRTEIEKKEGESNLILEQIQNSLLNIERLEKSIDQKKERIEKSKGEAGIYHTKMTALDVSLQGEKERLKEQEEVFSKLDLSLMQSESQVEQYKTDMIEKIKVTTDVKGSLSRIQAMLEQFETRQRQLDGEKNYLLSQMNDNETHIAAVEKKIENYKKEAEIIERNLEKLNRKKEEAEQNIKNCQMALEDGNRKITEKKSRFHLLSEMEKEHEGFFKSVKSVLKLKEKGYPQFQGIHGAVGELLHVEQRYETAIEIALGGSLQNIVTTEEQDAKKAIDYLKQNNLGRATFLPMSAVKGKDLGSEKNKLCQEQGYLGIAKELVRYDKQYEGIMSNLLGKVIIMENLDTAVLLAKKYHHAYRIVTLDGDIMNPGGAMTGGSMAKKLSNVFGRSREIKELQEEIIQIQQKITKSEEQKKDCQNKLEEFQSYTEEFREEGREIHINILSAKQDIEQTNANLTEQKEKLQYYHVEEKQLEEQCSSAKNNIQHSTEDLSRLEQEIQEIDEKLAGFQSTMQSGKSDREALLNEITELKIKIANYEQGQEAAKENLKRIENEIKEAHEDILSIQSEIKTNEFGKEEKKKEKEILLIKIGEQKQEQEKKQSYLYQLTEERKEISEKQNLLEQEAEEKQESISKMKNELFKLETKKENTMTERQRIFNEIWDEYEITYQSAKKYELENQSLHQLQKETKELKGKMKALGSVNVDAIEKYKEIKERYEFLERQREDILSAEEKLRSIISDLSSLMEIQFQEQFALISQNFNIVFQEMFGGGKAYLKLSDEENILESGIEIIAQPPGKNLQNMMLLSGGERALTAIAILFSILKMKPSPFCILDEIEAALDDANVKRFANYLKRFSGDTQFIVITHRKGTMEAADVMYGITMQEQGVSKVVSVKFSEEAV